MTELVCPQCETPVIDDKIEIVVCPSCNHRGHPADWLLIDDMRQDLHRVGEWEHKHDMKVGGETREGFRRWAGDKSEEIIHKHYPVDRLLEFERPLLRRDDR